MRSDEDDWDQYLNAAVFAINTSVQASIKATPFRMMFGREARFPLQAEAEAAQHSDEQISETISEENAKKHLEATTSQQKKLFAEVSQRIAAAQEKQKREYDKRKGVVNYHIKAGDEVLWRNMLQVSKKGHKMEDRWNGPYVVANEPSKGTCNLKNRAGVLLKRRVHLSQLKPYVTQSSQPPSVYPTPACVASLQPVTASRGPPLVDLMTSQPSSSTASASIGLAQPAPSIASASQVLTVPGPSTAASTILNDLTQLGHSELLTVNEPGKHLDHIN